MLNTAAELEERPLNDLQVFDEEEKEKVSESGPKVASSVKLMVPQRRVVRPQGKDGTTEHANK